MRAVRKAIFILTLAACPAVAYWGESRNMWYLPGIVVGLTVFYFGCALVMRSQAVAGAIIGALLGFSLNPPAVNGHARDATMLGSVVFLATLGAAVGWGLDSAKRGPPSSSGGFV